MEITLFGMYLFLALYNAGNMTSLQLQHYSIYHLVGKEYFQKYIQANNEAAFLPAVLPGTLLLLASFVLVFLRPTFVTFPMALVLLAFNVIAMISTFAWQRRLQSEMALTGYDEGKVRLLLATNWIRTIAFMAQELLVVVLAMNALM
jgi:hypothetical protein